MGRDAAVFVTCTAGSMKRRLRDGDRRQRARRQSRPDTENLGASTKIHCEKGAASSSGADGIRMTPSTINMERNGNSKVDINLELSRGNTTPSSESDCTFSWNPLINTEAGGPWVWTSSASPDLETPWSTPTVCSPDELNEEAVYDPESDVEEEHSRAIGPQTFRIEIPPPPRDWWNWPTLSPSTSGIERRSSSEASSEPVPVLREPSLRKGCKGRPPGSRNKKTILRERRRKVMRMHHEAKS